MSQNWYQTSKQILEKIAPEDNRFSPKGGYHYTFIKSLSKSASPWTLDKLDRSIDNLPVPITIDSSPADLLKKRTVQTDGLLSR